MIISGFTEDLTMIVRVKPSRQESLTNYGQTLFSESKGLVYKPAVEYSGWRLTTISRETCIMLLGLRSSYCQYRWYPKPQTSDTGNHWWVQCFALAFYIRWGGEGDLTRRNSYRSRNFHVRLFPMESNFWRRSSSLNLRNSRLRQFVSPVNYYGC